MKNYIIFIILSGILLISCTEDSTEPSNSSTLKIRASIDNPLLTKSKKAGILATNVDSMRINSFRAIISSIKLNDSVEDEKKKTGPFLVGYTDKDGGYVVTEMSLPEGSYEKIKFELHKFPGNDWKPYEGDGVFGDFANEKKNTILASGTYYIKGETYPFEFESNQTENLSLKFREPLELKSGAVEEIVLELTASNLFMSGDDILPPTTEYQKEIEKNIHQSIVAVKSYTK